VKWFTRERVKVDRVACPWLIKNFVDKDFLGHERPIFAVTQAEPGVQECLVVVARGVQVLDNPLEGLPDQT
jgi:hypothetical protein